MRYGAVIAAAVLLAPAPAEARDYYYFHRSGVDRDRYAADRLTCERLTAGVSRRADPVTIYVPQSSTLSPSANAASVAIASLFAGLILGNPQRAVVDAVERTCMADKGYARYKVDKKVLQPISALPTAEARIDEYVAMATATTPTGERIKE